MASPGRRDVTWATCHLPYLQLVSTPNTLHLPLFGGISFYVAHREFVYSCICYISWFHLNSNKFDFILQCVYSTVVRATRVPIRLCVDITWLVLLPRYRCRSRGAMRTSVYDTEQCLIMRCALDNSCLHRWLNQYIFLIANNNHCYVSLVTAC